MQAAALVELDSLETGILRKIVHPKTLGDSLKERARIVLAASEGLNNRQIALVLRPISEPCILICFLLCLSHKFRFVSPRRSFSFVSVSAFSAMYSTLPSVV